MRRPSAAEGSAPPEPAADDPTGICRDPERIAAFAPYDILDTPREAEYDDLAQLAAQVCKAPIAVVNLVLADRQWFKAEVGLGIRETGLDVSICRHLLLTPGLTVVPDTREEPRFLDNPLVAGEPGLRFYAGHLLATPDGVPLGTLCVLDHRPRPGLDPEQRFALATLARQLASQLELRRAVREQWLLVEQKDLLLLELNHRVKNSLQLAAGLLQLQSAHGGGDARISLAEARNRVLTVAELHEQLHRYGGVREVELGGYLRALLASVASPALEGADALELRVEAARAAPLPSDRAVSVALIVNELVTNAAKHAHPDGARPRVVVRVETGENGAHRVTVEDDGVGLPAGFDPGAGASLGMKIVGGLTRQLEGALTWNNEGSARFRLELPPAPG